MKMVEFSNYLFGYYLLIAGSAIVAIVSIILIIFLIRRFLKEYKTEREEKSNT